MDVGRDDCDPEARALVLVWLEKVACLGGIERIRLELRTHNEEARAFYERLEFRATELRRGYYDERQDAINMVRRIGCGSHMGAGCM